jgi:hypothetical protein
MARKNQRVRSGLSSKSRSKVSKSKGRIQSKGKEIDGIKFKSMLEVFTYKKLKEAYISLEYEQTTFRLMEGFYYPAMCIESRKGPEFEDKNGTKVRDITYTPDFIGRDESGKILWVIECKGFANDRFPNTWKNFKKHLIETGQVCPLFLPKNQKQVLQVIEIIKSL